MNRRRMLRILAVALMLFVAVPAAPTFATPTGDIIYLGLGDSLAEGEGATDHQHNGYIPRLFGFLHGRSHGDANTLVNLGVGGETSGSFIANGQMAEALATIADPDSTVALVTLDIGGNDLLDLLWREPCATDPMEPDCRAEIAMAMAGFAQNYTIILGTLTPALAVEPGHPQLYIMTYYNPWSGTGDPMETLLEIVLLGSDYGSDTPIDCVANATDPLRVGINDIITCLGSAAGAVIVDGYSPFDGKGAVLTHILEGDVHPNNAGHAQIAQAFRNAYLNR